MKWIIQSSLCISYDCETGLLNGILCIVGGGGPFTDLMIFITKVIRRSNLENCTRGQQESRFLSSSPIREDQFTNRCYHTHLALPSKTLPTNCKARQTTASPPYSHPRPLPNINQPLPIHPCPYRTLAPISPISNKYSEIKRARPGKAAKRGCGRVVV
jgi:hypothetical protein